MSMRGTETHYQVLGTHAHASAAEVKAAFKRQALALHPDKGGSKEAFQRALRAFEVLSDESSRAEYDSLQKAKRPKGIPKGAKKKTTVATKAGTKSAPVPKATMPQAPSGQPKVEQPRPQAAAKRSHRLNQIKTLEDGLMAKVFFLLQKLTPSRRLKLLKESFSQPHRLALEAWVLAQKKGQRHLSLAEPANTGSQCGPETEQSQQTGTMAAETLAIEDAEVEQVQQTEPATHSKIRQPRAANAMRGIASFHRRGTVFYQVSVCVQSFSMTARKVKDLDRAVDILLILMSIKQKVGRIVEPDLFAKKMADTVPAVLEEHGVTAEDLGLRFQVMMCMRFWVRPPLHTPQEAKLEDALTAWARLTRFRAPVGQGAWGFNRIDLNKLQERWLAFREVYLDIVETGKNGRGDCSDSRRLTASKRLDDLAEATRPQRERRLERWNRLAMLQEDRPRHRSKKAAQAFERAQRGRKRKASQLVLRSRKCRDAASTGRRKLWQQRQGSASEAPEGVWKRLLRLLARWDRAHRKAMRILDAEKKAAEREATKEAARRKQKEAQAFQQAQREKRAAMSEEKATAKRLREEQRSRWKWLNRKDITMEELLHSKGCHSEAFEGTAQPCQPGYTSPLLV